MLIDTVSTEIKFEQYFFGGSVLFQPLFGKIVDSYLVRYNIESFRLQFFFVSKRICFRSYPYLLQEWLDSALNNCYDPVSVMLMMINVEEDKETLKGRIVQDLDPYLAKAKFKLAARLNLVCLPKIISLFILLLIFN